MAQATETREFGMFSRQGNYRVRQAVNRLRKRGITDYYNADHRQIVEDEQYRIASLDGHAHHEVHDTDVREQMWAALEE
jgi:hypothetical protein